MSRANRLLRASVLERLTAAKADLARAGVGKLWVFGSVARDDAASDSDVDLIVEPAGDVMSAFDLLRLETQLSERLERPVDLLDARGLARAPELAARVARDAIRVF